MLTKRLILASLLAFSPIVHGMVEDDHVASTKTDANSANSSFFSEELRHVIVFCAAAAITACPFVIATVIGKRLIADMYRQKIQQMEDDEENRKKLKLEEGNRIREERIKIAEDNRKADLDKFIEYVQGVKNGDRVKPNNFEENEEIFWDNVNSLQAEIDPDEKIRKYGTVYMVYRRMKQGRRPS